MRFNLMPNAGETPEYVGVRVMQCCLGLFWMCWQLDFGRGVRGNRFCDNDYWRNLEQK